MILNPIAIATQGYVANNYNLALATRGYVDIEAAGGLGTNTHDRFNDLGLEQAIREDEELMVLIMGFLECH